MRNRTIDSRQIAAFAALVRHGRFTLAAQTLFLTQSAISHAIKSLEQDMGCRLFERTGRTIVLTRAGERFHQHTEKILSEMRAARLEIEKLSPENHVQLCVGSSTLASQYILPQVLKQFKQSYPKCVVRLEPGNLPDLLRLLRANEIDFAIGLDDVRPVDFCFEELFADELLFFVSAQHPWAHLSRVPRAALAAETYVVPIKNGPSFAIVDNHFRSEKITPKNLIAPGSLDAAKELVTAGFGVGVFARWQVTAESAQGALVAVPLTPKRLVRNWVVVRLKGRELVQIEREFIARCKSAFQSLGTQPLQ